MGRNRKNKNFRSIIVNDIEYKWRVCDFNCDGDGSCKYQIWLNKNKIFEELINSTIITPKNVRETILEKKL